MRPPSIQLIYFVFTITFFSHLYASGDPQNDHVETCTKLLNNLSTDPNDDDKKEFINIFDEISFSIHRNGEPNSCGTVPSSTEAMSLAISSLLDGNCQGRDNEQFNKFQIEAVLTQFFGGLLSGDNACGPVDDNKSAGAPSEGLFGFCDMGPDRTVINPDYKKLVRVRPSNKLPCRFFTREGVRITSLNQLVRFVRQKVKSAPKEVCSDATEEGTCVASNPVELYAVPAGRVFMFAPSFVGETFELDHVSGENEVSLKVLSLEPRLFDITNFFSREESDNLMNKALRETSSTHKFHRSTTGVGTKTGVFNKRTSENAWDTHGATALKIKRRCFTLLGFDEYQESLSDGLQILRYNLTTAYTPHMDYLKDKSGHDFHNYDTSGKGSNRFATILLYFSDVDEKNGGQTVFTEAYPPDVQESDRVPLDDAIKELRESGDASLLNESSWEEEMTAKCRTRLTVQPRAARAVLFYSQMPNGTQDPYSKHGGCPVLGGPPKIAANLWTWSGIRPDFDGSPVKDGFTKPPKNQKKAKFKNSGTDPRFNNAEVYYDEAGFFGKLGPNDPQVNVNTFEGHKWNIKANGKTLKTFIIGKDKVQEFVV